MRIDLNPRSPEAQEAGTAGQSGGRRAAGAQGKTPGGDTAQLSSDQGRVQSLAAQINNLPEIRQEKVDALRRVIREGNYDVTAEQTANAMLSEIEARPAA
jgi:flagellar biosynthesis anti-sigma factor FlgM